MVGDLLFLDTGWRFTILRFIILSLTRFLFVAVQVSAGDAFIEESISHVAIFGQMEKYIQTNLYSPIKAVK